MKIGLLTDSASRLGGGVFEAVVAHATLLRECGIEPVVFALRDAYSEEDRGRLEGIEVITSNVLGPRTIGYAPSLAQHLLEAELDIVHQHGIWRYTSAAAANWTAATRRPLVISPHGMLDPWITGRGRFKKRIARLWFEHRSWGKAALFHALTSAEAADIARETGCPQIATIPNPIKLSSHGEDNGDFAGGAPFYLFISRVHEKKNIDGMIEGWRRARTANYAMPAQLLICGWGETQAVSALEAKLAMLDDPEIRFLGPVFGNHKTNLLRHARFLVLPSFSEGLPVTILEAWAAGTPTLMSKHCNLPAGFDAGAAIECGTAADAVAAAFDKAFSMDVDTWSDMSRAATALAGRFAPDTIGARWMQVYHEVIER